MAQLKYQQIFNEIRSQIISGRLAAGDPLPTHQQMMARYSAALGTVRQAVVKLQHEGLVQGQRGKGMFVAECAEEPVALSAAAVIGMLIVASGQPEPALTSFLPASEDGRPIQVSMRAIAEREQGATAPWLADGLGYLICGACDSSLLDRFAATGQPVVYVGMTRDGRIPLQVHHVTWNIDDAVRMITGIVFGMGHRRVCLARHGGSAYCERVSRLYFEAASRAGVRDACDELIVTHPDWPADYAAELVSRTDPPTAVICENAFGACHLIHRVQNLGWPVPQQLSVAALGAAREVTLGLPGLTHVVTPVEAALRRAVELLADPPEGKRIAYVEVPLRLHQGETCTAIAPDAPRSSPASSCAST